MYVALAELGWKIDKGPAKDAFQHVAKQRRFNPVKEYLIGLENDRNIQPLNIDSLAYRYLQVESELSNAMLAACLVGAVARALDNGCQMDYLTCLKGKQGIHKSGFWRTLAGPFFSDTKQDNPKDMRLAIGSCWIYEWPGSFVLILRSPSLPKYIRLLSGIEILLATDMFVALIFPVTSPVKFPLNVVAVNVPRTCELCSVSKIFDPV